MKSANQGTNEMPRYIDPNKMRRIREEQNRLLEGAALPRDKKEARAKTEAQREADLSYRIPNSGLYERFSTRLERLTLDLEAERTRGRPTQKEVRFDVNISTPENSATLGDMRKWHRIVVKQLSDWLAALPRLAMIEMESGTEAYAGADDGRRHSLTSKSAPSNFFTWKQDDMQFTLSCLTKKPYTVRLHVDEGADIELSELCWINEDSLGRAEDEPIELKKFPLERIDEKTYRVKVSPGVFYGRLGSLTAAIAACERESEDSIDPQLLLPFVN